MHELALATALGLSGLVWWIRTRAEHARRLIAACAHEYEYVSLWNEGQLWVRTCTRCPFQEPVRDEELIERLRRQ